MTVGFILSTLGLFLFMAGFFLGYRDWMRGSKRRETEMQAQIDHYYSAYTELKQKYEPIKPNMPTSGGRNL